MINQETDTGEKKKKVVYEKRKKRPAPAKVEEQAVEEKPVEKVPEEKPADEPMEEASEESEVGDWDEVDLDSKAEEKSSSTSVLIRISDRAISKSSFPARFLIFFAYKVQKSLDTKLRKKN